MVDGLGALEEVGRRLLALDPERFGTVLRLAEAYLSLYEQPVSSSAELLERAALVTRKAVH